MVRHWRNLARTNETRTYRRDNISKMKGAVWRERRRFIQIG